MGLTDIVKKPQSHLTPVLVVLVAFIFVDLGVVLPAVLKEMQTKMKTEGLDAIDFAMLVIATAACIGKTIAAFMNKSFTRWADQRDEEHANEKRIETELRLKAGDDEVPPRAKDLQGGPLPGKSDPSKVDPEGHLR